MLDVKENNMRIAVFSIIAVLALVWGALFALPIYKKDFVKLEIGGVSVLAEVAESPRDRAQGLSGRESLPEFGGMFFTFAAPDLYGIWMKNMKFPIDIFWISKGHIVDLEEQVLPPARNVADSFLPIYRPDVPAQYVLETKAGFAKKHGLKIGDKIKVAGREKNLAGQEFYIQSLKEKGPDGKDFRIERKLTENSSYSKVLISYKSDGLKVSGTMNIAKGKKPETGFPVLILAHGLVPAEIYFPGRGSKREQDFFARKGYAVIHPDYLGLGESDPNPDKHHDFYVGYSRDVLNLLEALKKVKPVLLDLERIGMWGHSMGGGIAARVAVVAPEIKAFVLFAPLSADVKDNFYELPKSEIERLEKIYGTDTWADETYKQISPINYFSEVVAPIQLHHGTEDKDVPLAFSEKIHKELKKLNKKVEFFTYPGEPHEFVDGWSLAAERALQFFDAYVKNAK
jgi:uncharacterized membrane protein (UPF0127 family)/pimeloyl-ACP methyl ester carboxylesterase